MDIKKLTQEVLLKNMTPEQQMAVLESVQASVKEAKAVQKQKIAENVDLVLQALKRIEADMIKRVDGSAQVVEDRVKTIKDGKDGKNGIDGKAGRDGKDGKNGADGRNGKDGINGVSGERGQDGVGVQNAHIDFDGCLIIALTNGQELNVGEVVPFDVAEKIRIIGNGGGTSQFVIDTLASLQTQIDNFEALPSQTGNAGKFLTTNGTAASWASVAGGLSYQGTWNASTNTPTLTSGSGTNGYYYVVATSGSTNLNGITDWQIGDWLLFNGSTWQKIDQTNLVTSVAGRTGAVTLTYSDLTGTVPTWNQNTTGNAATATLAATATNVAYSGLTGTVPTWNQNTTGNAATATNVAYSGLTGTVPTWNQNTTGTASNVTGTVAVANGGTGSTTASGARTNLGLVIGTNVLAPNGSAASLTSFPTLNQNTTGTASNVTGTVAIANGGTGATTAGAALTNLGAYASSNPNGYTNNTGTVTSIVAGTGLSGGTITTSGTVALATSGVTASTYGSSTAIPVITVDAYGRATTITTATVAGGQYFGSASTKAIAYNSQTIAENVTVTTGNSGLSAGPITISSGYAVTVQAGSRWVIL